MNYLARRIVPGLILVMAMTTEEQPHKLTAVVQAHLSERNGMMVLARRVMPNGTFQTVQTYKYVTNLDDTMSDAVLAMRPYLVDCSNIVYGDARLFFNMEDANVEEPAPAPVPVSPSQEVVRRSVGPIGYTLRETLPQWSDAYALRKYVTNEEYAELAENLQPLYMGIYPS